MSSMIAKSVLYPNALLQLGIGLELESMEV